MGEDKISYDDLKKLNEQLDQQCKHFLKLLNENRSADMFKRMDYLFEVLKYSNHFNSDFVIECSDELMSIIKIEDKKESEA